MVVARHHGSVASSTNSSFTSLRTTQQYTALNTSRAFTATGPFIGVGSAATSENLWTARKGSSKLGLSSEDISAENVSNASSDGWQGIVLLGVLSYDVMISSLTYLVDVECCPNYL